VRGREEGGCAGLFPGRAGHFIACSRLMDAMQMCIIAYL
jgi:hypothetical protein